MQKAIALNTREWNAKGVQPPVGEEIYTAGEQPIAAHDNWWNWSVSVDLQNLNEKLGDHVEMHEAGGQQQLDLHGLGINSVGRLHGDTDGNEVLLVNPETDTSVARFDITDERIRQWPEFAIKPRFGAGAQFGGDVISQTTSTTLYDHSAEKFNHAKQADNADHATTASDSDTVDGLHASAFLQPDKQHTVTGASWTFQNIVHADIDGNAATAGHADEADQATNADHATTAGDSDTLDGYHASAFVLSSNNTNVSISDDGSQVLASPTDLNFGDGVVVGDDGDGTASVTAGPASDPVAEADHAATSDDSDTVDGYHAQDLIDESVSKSGDQWTLLTETSHADASTQWSWQWQASNPYDRYQLVIYHESHKGSGSKNYFDLQVGSGGTVDTRQRYNFTEFHTEGSGDPADEIGGPAGDERNSWEVGAVSYGGRSVSTFNISCPQPVNAPDWSDVLIGLESKEAGRNLREWLHHGNLTTDFSSIDTFKLTSHFGNSTGRIRLLGQNIS